MHWGCAKRHHFIVKYIMTVKFEVYWKKWICYKSSALMAAPVVFYKALAQIYNLKQSDWVHFANRPSWPIYNMLNLTVALREVGGLVSVWSVLGCVCMPSGILVSDALCLEPLLLIGRLKCMAVAPASGSCWIGVWHGLLHEAAERPPGSRVFKDRPETYTYIQSRC